MQSAATEDERDESQLFVDATDLNAWADRIGARSMLPGLLRRITHGSLDDIEHLTMRADEGVQLKGWDGVVTVSGGNAYVPEGTSGWELSTDKGIKAKATEDYEKRTDDPLGLDQETSAFVFVTPRRWGDKDEWVEDRLAEGKWKDVRAYDADNLAAWLESVPAVHIWFSRLLGKHPQGAIDLESFWEEWTSVTAPPLSPGVVLSGREKEEKEIQDWISATPSLLSVQAETESDASAFLAAAVMQLGEEDRERALSRAAVVSTEDAWRQLSLSKAPLILAADFQDRRPVAVAVSRGHHVFVPIDRDDPFASTALVLPRPQRDAANQALQGMGLDEDKAKALSHFAYRSLASLRRQMAVSKSLLAPWWAQPAEARRLVPVLLTGRWDEANVGDRKMLATLSARTYTDFHSDVQRWNNEPDSPIRRIGNTWLMVSREDAWSMLARFIGREDLQRFLEVTVEVLGEKNPEYELPAGERWRAAIEGKTPTHSSHLREGLAETLALLGAMDNLYSIDDSQTSQDWACRIVFELLSKATGWVEWASISYQLPLLAEGCPKVFLDQAEKALEGSEPPLAQLFLDDSHFMESSPHTGLLWALELLAWSEDYLGRVARVLAKLAQHDPGGRTTSRAMNSLVEVFRIWHPGTAVPLERRLAVVDALRSSDPDAAWQLMRGMIPSHMDVAHPTHKPKWRDWAGATEQ